MPPYDHQSHLYFPPIEYKVFMDLGSIYVQRVFALALKQLQLLNCSLSLQQQAESRINIYLCSASQTPIVPVIYAVLALSSYHQMSSSNDQYVNEVPTSVPAH
jgi:hypothetical protein